MILAAMQEFAERRMNRYQPILMGTFPPLTDFTSMTWIGTFSLSNPTMKARILDSDALVYLHPGIPQVPPEIARDYIRAKYTEKRRHTTEQFISINQHRSAPLFAKIGRYHDMALVDLKSAYWSILSVVGWDVDYHPSRWLGKRSEVSDFPLPDNKVARNSLISSSIMVANSAWDGKGSIISIKAHSMYINYDIWSLVMDVLHSIATIALKAGAVHIHTDGYIVPMARAEALINEIREWGLNASIKAQGDSYVVGVGAYQIGDRLTKKMYHFTPSNVSEVYSPDIAWLRQRFRTLAKSRINWSIHDNQDK